MMICQPDFVDESIFEATKAALIKKRSDANVSATRLEAIAEGLCVQIMHIGSYDDEPFTITKMDEYAMLNGYVIDIDGTRHHHEIYLSDPGKVAVKKLKTILRHPIKPKKMR